MGVKGGKTPNRPWQRREVIKTTDTPPHTLDTFMPSRAQFIMGTWPFLPNRGTLEAAQRERETLPRNQASSQSNPFIFEMSELRSRGKK